MNLEWWFLNTTPPQANTPRWPRNPNKNERCFTVKVYGAGWGFGHLRLYYLRSVGTKKTETVTISQYRFNETKQHTLHVQGYLFQYSKRGNPRSVTISQYRFNNTKQNTPHAQGYLFQYSYVSMLPMNTHIPCSYKKCCILYAPSLPICASFENVFVRI